MKVFISWSGNKSHKVALVFREWLPSVIQSVEPYELLPECQKQYAFLIVLNMLQDEFPWLYNIGKGLVDTLEAKVDIQKKYRAINDCRRLIEFTYDRSVMRNAKVRDRESLMLQRERHMMLKDALVKLLFEMEANIALEAMEPQLL